jgi:hypothetical protein
VLISGPLVDYNRGDPIVRYKYAMAGPRAPKNFEQWVEAYEERDGSKFILSPGERIKSDPERGFFTYLFDARGKKMIIPKMCGDGRHWKKEIRKVAEYLKSAGLIGEVYFCTKRNPAAFTRAVGGSIAEMEYYINFETGRTCAAWYISVKE